VRGTIGGAKLYQVVIKVDTFERAQVLTNLDELDHVHEDVTWLFHSGDPARIVLLTDKPEWFVDLERKLEDARRPR
jgi:hypothetical protein